ncbi:hypothetical protein [Halobacteriovorax marinus]|uniref:hypothetical protein n=1 Tax=Halobacteriovorax marinus TaxID=97084 RepID=UPI003A916E17
MKISVLLLIFTTLFIFLLKKPDIHLEESVLEYGNNSDNSMNYQFKYPDNLKLKSIEVNQFSNANHHTPLYLKLKNNSSFLLYTTLSNELVFWDTQKKVIKHKVKLPGTFVNSSPIISKKSRVLIVKTSTKDSNLQILTFIDFSGNILKSTNIYLHSAFKGLEPAKVSSQSQCKTALSLIETDEAKEFVIFGCSIKTQVYEMDKDIKLYGTNRGISGLVVASSIESHKNFFFKTSLKNTSIHSGFDTGIYLSGASIPTANNKLLIATGNGPFNGLDNFGCSILELSLNKSGFKLEKSYKSSEFVDNECHSLNLDMTSSSPVVTKSNHKTFLNIVDKSGVLHTFDHRTFGKEIHYKSKVSDLPHYSQGALLKYNNKDYFITHFKNSNYDDGVINYYSTVLERHLKTVAKSGFKKLECIGSISQEEAQEYSLLYSGGFRENFISTPQKLTAKLTSINQPSFIPNKLPFLYPVKGVWPKYSEVISGSKEYKSSKSRRASLNFYDFGESSILLIADPKNIQESELGKPLSSTQFKSTFNKRCNLKKYENIYILKKTTSIENSWGYKVFDKSHKKLEIVRQMNIQGDLNPNKTSITVIRRKKKSSLIFITAHREQKSKGFLIEPFDRKIIQEIDFQGTSYFSMPVWTPHFLFLPTRDKGIQVFEILE